MPFDYAIYEQKCGKLSSEQLQKEWENYTRQIAGGATSTATAVMFSPLTAGVSLVGLGLSGPRIHNARKKREIIEKELQKQGTTHQTRKRDVAGSMAVSGVIGGLTLGLAGPGADMIAGEAVGKGAEYVAAHVVLEGAGAVVERTHDQHAKTKGEMEVSAKMMQQRIQINMNGQVHQQQGYMMTAQGMSLVKHGQIVQLANGQMVQVSMGTPQPLFQLPQPGGQTFQTPHLGGLQLPQQGLQIPGFQYGAQAPPRPHSAAPDNKYQYTFIPPATNIVPPLQQLAPEARRQQTPQVYAQQTALSQRTPHNEGFQQLEHLHLQAVSGPQVQIVAPVSEKSPAFTTQYTQGMGMQTPLPAYTQQAQAGEMVPQPQSVQPENESVLAENEGVATMEQEIAKLKAELLKIELEKRGMSATITSPCEISLYGPEVMPTRTPPQPAQTLRNEEMIASLSTVQKQVDFKFDDVAATGSSLTDTEVQVTSVIVETVSIAESTPLSVDQPSLQQPHDSVAAPSVSKDTLEAFEIPQLQQSASTPMPQTQSSPPPPPALPIHERPADLHALGPDAQIKHYPPPSQQQRTHHIQESLAVSPVPVVLPYTPAPPVQQYTPPPPPSQPEQPQCQNSPTQQAQIKYKPPPPPPPQVSQYQAAPQSQPQAQQYAPPPPLSQTSQYQRQQYAPPPPPPQLQTYAPITSRPNNIPHDSGYYSVVSTPGLTSPNTTGGRPSSIYCPTPQSYGSVSPQLYTPQQPSQQHLQYQPYNPAMHGRHGSIASLVSPVGSPPPPAYFTPSPTAPQPIIAGKAMDYFNQGPYPQNGIQRQTQSVGGMQGWQWGSGTPQGVGVPNYGPVPVPHPWKRS